MGRLRRRPVPQLEPLEPRRLLDGSPPTALDQYLVELINWGRANPTAEAAKYGIDLNEGLTAGTISTAPKQPLAINPNLITSSSDHSLWMLETNTFSHPGAGGTQPGDRMADAGYDFTGSWGWGENIAYESVTPPSESVVNDLDELLFVDSSVAGRGHRLNLMDASFSEIGAGIEAGTFNGFGASMLTEDFAYTGTSSFLTGVAYVDDVIADNFYTPGEGLGGVTITATRVSDSAQFTTTTWSSGGYSLAPGAGTYNVVATGGPLGTSTVVHNGVVISSQNVEVDFVPSAGAVAALSSVKVLPNPGSVTVGDTLSFAGTPVDQYGNSWTPWTAVSILNPSFEDPVQAPGASTTTAPTSWTMVVPSGDLGGVYNDNATASTVSGQDANQMAYLSGSSGASGSEYDAQTLTGTLQANTVYTLNVLVGVQSDELAPSYTVQLRAGNSQASSSILASVSNSPALTNDQGSFDAVTLSYTSPSSVTAGQSLEVRLLDNSPGLAGSQVLFDDPVLTAAAIQAIGWSATGGTIDSTGLYHAGATPGGYSVTGAVGLIHGSATVNVTALLALTTPATATSVNAGNSFSINWTGGNPTDSVQIWSEGGPNGTWTELTTGVPASQGTYSWNTTGVLHGWYYFQAWDNPAGGTSYAVESPNYLHVVAPNVTQAPTVTLTNPVLAGEQDAQGASYTVHWTTTEQNTDANPLFVQLWEHNGTTNAWSILPNANSISSGSSGSYVWSTTNVAPGWYSFTAHITDGDLWGVGGPAANSPGWVQVTVPTPTITYLTPTSGQSTAAGGVFGLNWSISGLSDSDLSSSTVQLWAQHIVSGTAVWTEIAASVNAANGSYSWTVPSPTGTYYAFSMWMNYGNDWWIQASPNWVQVT